MPPKPRTSTKPAAAPSIIASTGKKTINLALQGGGAHGAFTWGVLDRILEDGRIDIEGISATSAGAMNAAAFAHGMLSGGRDGARASLENFWKKISEAGAKGPLQASWYDKQTKNHSLSNSPAFLMLDLMTRLFSPYELNPKNTNPLRDVLLECVDFDLLRHQSSPFKLFLSATNVRTGKIKVFSQEELSPEAVLASACLPFMFQAVEIDGEAYWDGGYMGNPALFPLIYSCKSKDVLIIHINPLFRPDVPKTARDILDRINEVSFNSSLMREMRAITFVTYLIQSGKIPAGEMEEVMIHSISADDVMQELGASSKLNADWEFLSHLKEQGRQYADEWLTANYDSIGVKTTVDIAKQYL